MNFRKGTFWVQMNEEYNYSVELREGWVDTTGTYGFYKLNNGWVAIDIASGTSLYWAKTRKGCVELIEINSGLIAVIKCKEDYGKQVDRFAARIEEAKNGVPGAEVSL